MLLGLISRVQRFPMAPRVAGRGKLHTLPKRFRGIDKDSDQTAFLSEMANRNAAFQSYPVHTGPGSKPGHRHVKPKNRYMEETFNEGIVNISSHLSTAGKSQIYYVNAPGNSHR